MSNMIEVGPEAVIEVLHALGANAVEEQRDEAGVLTGYRVSPAIDLAGYDAALAATRKAGLIAYAASARWQREVGGIVVAGVPVATDDRAKMMIIGARVAAMADPGWSTIWRGADGGTYPVDAAAMVAISDAVQAHVNAGFATFAAVKAAIEVGEVTSREQVAAAFG